MALPLIDDIPAQAAGEPLREEIARGLQYAHHRANTNTGRLLEVTSFAFSLIELLTEKDVISLEELDERNREVAARIGERFREAGMGVVHCEPEMDKYAYEGTAHVDCENRVHLCRQACCRLHFALSRQDVEERVIKWDFGTPYMIQQDPDGYCTHVDREASCCSVYEQRPIACRGYDCRGDERIWADFDNYVPSPDLDRLFTAAAGER